MHKQYENWMNIENWNEETKDGVFREKWMYLQRIQIYLLQQNLKQFNLFYSSNQNKSFNSDSEISDDNI